MKALEFAPYRRPLKETFRSGAGSWRERSGVMLRTRHSGGHFSYTEAAPLPGVHKESVEELLLALREGRNPIRFPSLLFALSLQENPPAATGTGSAVKLNATLSPSPGSSLEKSLEEISEAPEECIKIKWTPENASLVLKIVKAADASGIGKKIRLDANASFRRADFFSLVKEFPRKEGIVEFVEDPYAGFYDELVEMGVVDCGLPLAVDLLAGTEERIDKLLATCARLPIFVLKPTLFGHWHRTRKIVDSILSSGGSFLLSSTLEAEPGLRTLIKLATALPETPFAHGLASNRIFAEGFTLDGPNEDERAYLESLPWERGR